METQSFDLNDKPSINDFRDVQAYFGLPSVELVEKDWYVVKTLSAMVKADITPFRLVLGGGTSLSRAHRLIERMSEDIDMKIVGDREPTRTELRNLRDTITQAILNVGFCFDPTNRYHRQSNNQHRHTMFRLPYQSWSRENGILRPEIQLEVAVWPLYCAAGTLPVSSFVAEASNRPPEVAGLSCVAITQTAAEKFVALTRRIATEQANTSGSRDETLVRHIYDLHAIRSHYNVADVVTMAITIMDEEAKIFGNKYTAYRENPTAVTRQAVIALQTDAGYAEKYERFLQNMVYGEKITFSDCIGTLNRLVENI